MTTIRTLLGQDLAATESRTPGAEERPATEAIRTALRNSTRPPQAGQDRPVPEDLGTTEGAAEPRSNFRSGEVLAEPRSNSLPVVFLVGPTAIGKSHIAISVAQVLGTEILTADSTQVYRGMDIGTDKPRPDERGGVPHRLIDLVAPNDRFNAGQYRRAALTEISRLHAEGRIPLVVGGTGLYVRTLAYGLWEGPQANWPLRQMWLAEEASHGEGHLWMRLNEVDPGLAATLHPRDRSKIVRALEVERHTGVPLSEWHRRHQFQERPFQSIMVGLRMDRAALYRRIDARVLREIDDGLIEETRQLLAAGYDEHLGSMKALGYRQITGYLKGQYDYHEAVRRLQRDTRHFAKRQMTWFLSDPNVHWVSVEEDEPSHHVVRRVLDHLENRGIMGSSKVA